MAVISSYHRGARRCLRASQQGCAAWARSQASAPSSFAAPDLESLPVELRKTVQEVAADGTLIVTYVDPPTVVAPAASVPHGALEVDLEEGVSVERRRLSQQVYAESRLRGQ